MDKIIIRKISSLEFPSNQQKINWLYLQNKDGTEDMISYLQVENLSKRFGEQLLFEHISFGVGKGQKVALIAKNGMGKSTLLRIIAGKDTPESGTVIFRNDIRVGILEQEPTLEAENTVFEEVFRSDAPALALIREYEEAVKREDTEALERLIPEMDAHGAWDYETTVKQILSELKIDLYDRKIRHLSGGQKKRVGLAKVLISNPDFLILDEPTNHLDIDSKEILEKALNDYTGTLLYVSHDRYFINQTATRILDLTNHTLVNYMGSYDYYLEKRDELTAKYAPAQESSKPSPAVSQEKLSWKQKKEEEARKRKRENDLKKTERRIEELEERDGEINQLLSQPEIATDVWQCTQLSQEQETIQDELETLYEQWEDLAEASEQISS